MLILHQASLDNTSSDLEGYYKNFCQAFSEDDLTLVDKEKVFLEEQLKYYFEFSDNRWDLNVVESELQVV